MKNQRILITICIAAWTLGARVEHTTRIVGVVNLEDLKAVWVEMQDSPTNSRFHPVTTSQLLKEGDIYTDQEIAGAHVQIKIIQINFTNGTVKAEENGAPAIYQFKPERDGEMPPVQAGVFFNEASWENALNLFGQMTRRTLLVHPEVYGMPALISIQARDTAGFAKAFEARLNGKNIAVVPDGGKFELIFPVALEKTYRPMAQSPSTLAAANSIPAYNLNLGGVDLDTVLDLYGNLIGRKLIQRPPIFRPYTIQTQAPLTKAEVIHAFDVLLAYHGLKAENVGDDAFRIVFRASAEN